MAVMDTIQIYRGIFRIIRIQATRNFMVLFVRISLTAYAATHVTKLEVGDMSTLPISGCCVTGYLG